MRLPSPREPSPRIGHREDGRLGGKELSSDGPLRRSEDIFGAVQLPAGVRRRINNPPERGPRFLPRLDPRNARVAEDPRQFCRRGDWSHPEEPRLLVNTDRPMSQPGLLERGANPDRLTLHLVHGSVRARPRPAGSRLQSRRRALLESPPSYRLKRLPEDAVLDAEGTHRAPRRVRRPLEFRGFREWRVRDSNPRMQSSLIYSQIPLAAWVTRHARPAHVIIDRKRSNNATRCCACRVPLSQAGSAVRRDRRSHRF